MPFALTMFSCLARFRVLLMQVLYEVVSAFNLLSTVWQRKRKPLIYSVEGNSVSTSDLGQNWLPAEIECHWDSGTGKLSVEEKKKPSVLDCRRKVPDIPADASQLWFVDDRTGVKCVLQVPSSTGGPSAEHLSINSQLPSGVHHPRVVDCQVDEPASLGPIMKIEPDLYRSDPKDDVTEISAKSRTPAKNTRGQVEEVKTCNRALDLPGMAPTGSCGWTEISESRELSVVQRPLGSRSSEYVHDSGTSSAAKRSVAYRSISHKIAQDPTSVGNANSQVGVKRKGAEIGIDLEARSSAEPDLKEGHLDSKDRSSKSDVKEKKTNDIFAMLLGGSE